MNMKPANNPETDHADDTGSTSENARAAKIMVAILLLLVAWGMAIFVWGVPGLYIPAVALVPVIWIALITMAAG